ncbi:ATP-dependent helicase HrpB [hydrothermal vent metagenome]|uniref:ATP-dependent helicase HrpB n=1 Tax=hydrothermal vent metagenome TaxID=652676 RepID=A0A3B1BD13_9ZZZZ
MHSLPINDVIPALCEALASTPAAVLSAPPGSGKTTVTPLVLLEQPWLRGQSILLLEPRRLAARASAMRMAELLGEEVGETVGYRVRFDSRVSRKTRIEVVTEGILTRRLQSDSELAGVGLVIFDEFHERNLQADLGLAFCLDIAHGLRDDLRLLVMSATLDTKAVSALLGNAPIITGAGKCYPVERYYLDATPNGRIADVAVRGVRRALSEQQGDMLVFLPGAGEISSVAAALGTELDGIEVCPLYGDLSREAQDHAIRPHSGGRRRVVLATSIAETSLTIEGIRTVVDVGWSRLPGFDPNTGLTRLETMRVSRAAADQRAGRAGRLEPGVCYRLWTESEQAGLQSHTPPEIMDADMAPLVLELAQWGLSDPAALKWLDAPPVGAFAQAKELLQGLDALDSHGRITLMGKGMAGLGLHPRLAHMLLLARERGQGEMAADLAALLSERDLLPRVARETKPVDLEQRLQLLNLWREKGKSAARTAGVDHVACSRVDKASRQWRKGHRPVQTATANPLSIGALLASAYPDRIAQRRSGALGGYLLSSGRGAKLPEGDVLSGCNYLVAAQLDAGRSEGRVFLAASVELAELRETQNNRINRIEVVQWDTRAKVVAAREEERLGALVLSTTPIKKINPEALITAMLDGVRQMGLEVLPWTDKARDWQARVLSLRHWQPDAGWPDVSLEALMQSLEQWLPPWLNGLSRRDHLSRLDMLKILHSTLDWQQQKILDEIAPTHIQVPSGSFKQLQYKPGEPPVLGVRLQEMFGLADTPTVCRGRVPVMLHLLSPAQRPIQVTQDLRGFWERTYVEVKKELKGRYPKHYWPDDPWAAEPTARVRPKR